MPMTQRQGRPLQLMSPIVLLCVRASACGQVPASRPCLGTALSTTTWGAGACFCISFQRATHLSQQKSPSSRARLVRLCPWLSLDSCCRLVRRTAGSLPPSTTSRTSLTGQRIAFHTPFSRLMFFKEHALAWCAWSALLLQKFPARAHTREGRIDMMNPQRLESR